MKRATTAQTAQIFSHFHRVVYLVGAAKLPFTRPAANAISTPKLTSLTLPPGRLDYRTTNLSACGLGVVGVAQLARIGLLRMHHPTPVVSEVEMGARQGVF